MKKVTTGKHQVIGGNINQEGEIVGRVYVRYKVSIGHLRGQVINGRHIDNPEKLMNFEIMSRNKDGDWDVDQGMHKLLWGSEEKPTSLSIRLFGDSVDEMIKSDRSYYVKSGLKCSCGDTTPLFEYVLRSAQFGDDTIAKWNKLKGNFHTFDDISRAIDSKKLPEYLRHVITLCASYMEKFKARYKDGFVVTEYDLIHRSFAARFKSESGKLQLFPCAGDICPFASERLCKFHGRFFFQLESSPIGEISMFATTSRKNIQSIQWALGNVIGPVVNYKFNGVRCRLFGQPHTGSYNDGGKTIPTVFFLVTLTAPHLPYIDGIHQMKDDSKIIHDMYKDFHAIIDEGDEEQITKDRMAEFVQSAPDVSAHLVRDTDFNMTSELPAEISEDKANEGQTFLENVKMLCKGKNFDPDLLMLIEKYSEIIANVPGPRLDELRENIIKAIKDETITSQRILSTSDYLKKVGINEDIRELYKGIVKGLSETNESQPAPDSDSAEPSNKSGATFIDISEAEPKTNADDLALDEEHDSAPKRKPKQKPDQDQEQGQLRLDKSESKN